MTLKYIAAGVLLSVLTVSAQASLLRFEGGRVALMEGDSVSKMKHYLGKPDQVGSERVCKPSPYRHYCDSTVMSRVWFYRYENLNWRIRSYRGKIISIDWSRFGFDD